MKIYLLRHAQTGDNIVKRYTGGNDKVGINREGVKQVRAIISFLKKEEIKTIYSSPYRRCLETARLINKYLKVKLVTEERLREVNYGKWQGLTSAEVKMMYPEEFAARGKNPALVAPPGGETLLQMQKRVTRIIEEIVCSRKDSLIVTHGSCIRSVLMHFQNIGLEKFWEYGQTNRIPNCSWWEVSFVPGKPRPERIMKGF